LHGSIQPISSRTLSLRGVGKELLNYWNPLLRTELRHNLRRLSGSYAAIAWHAYRAAETTLRLKLGAHSLHDLLEWGDELSARHSQECVAGPWDFVHVAIANHLPVECFITCDAAQADLAHLAGVEKIKLFV
jgi:hypothetical protein